MSLKLSLVLIALIIIGYLFSEKTSTIVIHGPGIMIEDEPYQASINKESFQFNDYHIHPRATFEAEAKVLSKKSYSFGRESDLSPIDLTLGWGPMSDETILELIDISQRSRFYYWQVNEFPISRKAIEHNSANMHMIPANSTIEKQLKKVKQGELVSFKGYLVNITSDDGWRWNSSLSRKDTGSGACELVWLEEFEVISPIDI